MLCRAECLECIRVRAFSANHELCNKAVHARVLSLGDLLHKHKKMDNIKVSLK